VRAETLNKNLALNLRKSMTAAERVLWYNLRDRRLGGWKSRRQHAVGFFIKVFASGDEVIDLEVLFPPAEEIFDLPSEFINQGEVFGGKVKAIGGHPIFRPTD
jgi:hypothetical protein